MAEGGTECSQAIRPAVTGANDGFRSQLLGYAEARSKHFPVLVLVPMTERADAENVEQAGVQVLFRAVPGRFTVSGNIISQRRP